jgi:hypothetical protein
MWWQLSAGDAERSNDSADHGSGSTDCDRANDDDLRIVDARHDARRD